MTLVGYVSTPSSTFWLLEMDDKTRRMLSNLYICEGTRTRINGVITGGRLATFWRVRVVKSDRQEHQCGAGILADILAPLAALEPPGPLASGIGLRSRGAKERPSKISARTISVEKPCQTTLQRAGSSQLGLERNKTPSVNTAVGLARLNFGMVYFIRGQQRSF